MDGQGNGGARGYLVPVLSLLACLCADTNEGAALTLAAAVLAITLIAQVRAWAVSKLDTDAKTPGRRRIKKARSTSGREGAVKREQVYILSDVPGLRGEP